MAAVGGAASYEHTSSQTGGRVAAGGGGCASRMGTGPLGADVTSPTDPAQQP